ncbi:MAG: AAA family ATPase [Candidatus Omnitrophica bacterium]|jgi:Holliday junction resolvasome RuvABC ATP-dependent DNA helicase subunit|nr:AAA family ATPase [Candidatus Omnitrophota bacterium]
MLEILFIVLIVVSLSFAFGGKKSPQSNFNNESGDIDLSHCVTKLTWKSNNDTLTLKQPSFDVSKIKSYDNLNQKKFEFRPQTFDQFIGQEEAKERAKTIIKKVRTGMKAHLIVDGVQGGGKTSYIEILARSIPAKLISRVGRQIDEEEVVNIINEINTTKEDFIMLFIDEIDTIDPKILKIFNPIVESFNISGKGIRPFIFAGATINKHKLIKTNPDFLDRLPHSIKFDRYNSNEIKQIIIQYKDQLYSEKKVNDDIQDIISRNCKFNPRISLGLLEDFIIEQDINKVMHNSKIVKDGLTIIDIDILRVLSEAKRPMGANNLATKVKLSEQQYCTEFEPYLVSCDYINRIPSRIITDKGRQILEAI